MLKRSFTLGGISTSVEGCRRSEVQLTGETWRKLYLFGKHYFLGQVKMCHVKPGMCWGGRGLVSSVLSGVSSDVSQALAERQ